MTQTESRRGKLQALGELMPSAVDFVWEAKARAEASRARAAEAAVPTAPPPRRHCPEAEEMVLALARRFGGRPDEQAAREAQARTRIATPDLAVKRETSAPQMASGQAVGPERPVHHGIFARPDDATLADATWLHMTFAAVPALQRGNLRAAAAGRERLVRGVWRAGFAEVLRLPPAAVSSPVGAMVAAARRVQSSGHDPRTLAGYCAASGWGPVAYRLLGVEGLVHSGEDCHCQGG